MVKGRIGMTATRVGTTVKQIDSKIAAAKRELKAGGADADRTQMLEAECHGLVAVARTYGAEYVVDFATGDGSLQLKTHQVPTVDLDLETLIPSLDGTSPDVSFKMLTDIISLERLSGCCCGASYLTKSSPLAALEKYRLINLLEDE